MAAPSIHNTDHVSGEQYRYALTNFAIAHQKVEEQRAQLEEQERQIARLQERIAALEGSPFAVQPLSGPRAAGGSSVDDFSIKNTASQLERTINRWAGEVLRLSSVPAAALQDAALADLAAAGETALFTDARPMMVQSLLRHAMAEAISEGIINCLIVTSSAEANVQLTHIHEHLFARDPTVAAVWRRQSFSAAVENVAPEMTRMIFQEHVPSLAALLDSPDDPLGTRAVLEDAYRFSRMLHGAPAAAGPGADAFYRSFVPELASTLYPRQVELAKRCRRSERGELDRVGATIFPGLVKVSRTPPGPGVATGDTTQTVVRRAQVICECALQATSYPASAPPPPPPTM
ncbi:hypothetical protein F5148DRAFT_996086 [Russula earlei]|uniref:Uncharacterized protein n=1 Tax=Russula earlei TaxID=71964 RepID=A0ACC0UEX8_9AGAM|nr:hypothetical protein F5148DRAFT_996086 [Russula earlei]